MRSHPGEVVVPCSRDALGEDFGSMRVVLLSRQFDRAGLEVREVLARAPGCDLVGPGAAALAPVRGGSTASRSGCHSIRIALQPAMSQIPASSRRVGPEPSDDCPISKKCSTGSIMCGMSDGPCRRGIRSRLVPTRVPCSVSSSSTAMTVWPTRIVAARFSDGSTTRS